MNEQDDLNKDDDQDAADFEQSVHNPIVFPEHTLRACEKAFGFDAMVKVIAFQAVRLSAKPEEEINGNHVTVGKERFISILGNDEESFWETLKLYNACFEFQIRVFSTTIEPLSLEECFSHQSDTF